ncbi:RNA-guided endonuclease TnpB family protein [Endozoicomonas sp. 4G]|uniref:RNA-guided endonuclease InsQ/TnpB family protein n=1 Tax=Endozoicomonas sp. 4G TaxID=2872754 RepID=UPI002078B709|nr:RNA-guided endonuclease TnpB family protein [Endozoicomonas sp. 4G]
MKKNRVIQINIGKPTDGQTQVRLEAARLWNDIVRLHRYIRKRHWKWPTESKMKAHIKGKYALHSQTIQKLVEKLYDSIDSTQTKREKGDKKARYPWKCKKKFQTVTWKQSAIRRKGNRLNLSNGRGVKGLSIKIPLDQLPQGKNKKIAGYTRLIDKCEQGSRRRRKLKAEKARYLARYHRQVHNLLHHTANKIIDFAVERQAGTLVVGDVTEIARNKRKQKKGSRRSNQENSGNPLGRLVEYLTYKGKLRGVDVVKINESYTTQTCPKCGHRHKPSGRNYKCQGCGYVAARDEVGACNILNKYFHNGRIVPGSILPTGNVKYLRPTLLRKSPVVVALNEPTLLGTTLESVWASEDAGLVEPSKQSLVA